MILLCMDGLDSDLLAEMRLHQPHEATPTVEPELCINYGEELSPHTLHVWPSMFAGRVVRHPMLKDLEVSQGRRTVREFLHGLGIHWRRKGTHLYKGRDEAKGIIYTHSVEVKDTVFNGHSSLLYQVPGITDNFILGGPDDWYTKEHTIWGAIARVADTLPYRIVALYTRQPDHLGHNMRNPAAIYRECFTLARRLRGDVMVLSDHGCSPKTGNHTMRAYIGANFPFKADSVLDVRRVIEERLSRGETE